MTKIVCFSDLHGQYSKKLTKWFHQNPGDILLFAGDLQLNNFDDGEEFLAWLSRLPYKHKVMVFGNHDGNFEYTIDVVSHYPSVTILHHQSIVIEGIKIFGDPSSKLFGNWWHMLPEEGLAKVYKDIPEDTDILLTHTPPFGIMDQTYDCIMAGSQSLLKRVYELPNLKYHVFGHIHEARGIYKDGLTFINASVLDERYQLVHEPFVLEYN